MTAQKPRQRPRKRIGLFAFVMVGVGTMLLPVGGDATSKERAAAIANPL